MSDRTFDITYDLRAPSAAAARQRARERVERPLLVGFEYEIIDEQVLMQNIDTYEVVLTVRVTRTPPRMQTNLAFHSAFTRASDVRRKARNNKVR